MRRETDEKRLVIIIPVAADVLKLYKQDIVFKTNKMIFDIAARESEYCFADWDELKRFFKILVIMVQRRRIQMLTLNAAQKIFTSTY